MKLRNLSFSVLAAAAGLTLAGKASAVTVTIGAPHFTNGQVIGTGTFIGAVAGQPAPFDQFYGGDVAGPDFDVTWTFTFPAPAAVYGASLTLGLFDGDFAEVGQQLSLMTWDGTVVTGTASAIFEAGPGATGAYGIYTVVLPPAVFSSMMDGSATVHLTLARGSGAIGATSNNGAGIDHAVLDILEVPEASTTLLAGLGAAAAVTRRRRTLRA